jgi:hypothetical protein
MHHHVTSLFYLYLIVDVITCIARSSSSSSSIPTSVDAFSPALRLLNHNGHCDVTAGFSTTSNNVHRIIKQWQLRQYNYNHDDDENENENENNQDNINIKNELAWRTSKVRLEEEENKIFSKMLKSKPYKLPYKDAKQWVQRNLGASTQEEFEDLVLNGNLRTPYIPKDPQRYYTEIRGSPWLGWDDFLLV